MDNSKVELLALSSIGVLLSFGLYGSYKYYKKKVKQHSNLKKIKPLDVNTFKKIRSSFKQGDQVVLRVLPNLQKPQNETKDFYSNHQFYCRPDERNYVKEKIQIEQQKYDRKIWKGHDINELLSFIQLKGLGQVLDGVMEVDVQAVKTVSFRQLPFYKKIYFYLAGIAEYILETLAVLISGKYRSFVFLKGVKVGDFMIKYDWFKGHMLVECEIGEQSDLLVKTVGLSNDTLIHKAQDAQIFSFQGFVFVSCLWLLSIYGIYRAIKLIRKRQKTKEQGERLFKYKQLTFEADQNGNTCIICMEYNRNLLFDSCGHFLACTRCSDHFRNNRCPLCKQQIHARKIYAIQNDE